MIFLYSWTELFWIPLLVLVIGGIILLLIKKNPFRPRIRMSINYTDSFWTLFEEGYYVVLNLTIVNDNDFPLNNLTFGSEPAHTLLNNIWSKHISLRNGTTKGHIPSMPQIENAFGENPITIALRDSKTGNLVFDSIRNGCDITQLIASHDRNNISIAVIPNQITQRDIN